MSGTIHSTDGRPQANHSREPLRARMMLFAAAVALGAAGLVWIDTSIWSSMQELERRFADVRTERFYQGVRLRHDLEALNERLLQYQLGGEQRELDLFLAQASQLRERIRRLETEAATPEARALASQLGQAFDAYLGQTVDAQIRSGLFGPSRRKVEQIHETLAKVSLPILRLCEELVTLQRHQFQVFLVNSQSTLSSFQALLSISLATLLLLALLIVVLGYRGLLMPLRSRLSTSEAAMLRHEKLASLGTLSAGVAHEIRNPLTAIKFRLFSLRQSLPDSPSSHEDADVIDQELNRLERIVQDFIQFARPSDPCWVDVPAFRLLDEIKALMTPTWESASIQVQIHAPHDIWLRVDPQQFKQVLINLIQNAVESMKPHGQLTIRVADAVAHCAGKRQPTVVTSVSDTGPGIPSEARPRLFDPFFTTKEGGTGLGLAIAARIVEKLGGELTFSSEPEGGTTFRILLPRPQHTES